MASWSGPASSTHSPRGWSEPQAFCYRCLTRNQSKAGRCVQNNGSASGKNSCVLTWHQICSLICCTVSSWLPEKASIHIVNWHLHVPLRLCDVGEPHCHTFAHRVFSLRILSLLLVCLSVSCVFFKDQLMICLLWLTFNPPF